MLQAQVLVLAREEASILLSPKKGKLQSTVRWGDHDTYSALAAQLRIYETNTLVGPQIKALLTGQGRFYSKRELREQIATVELQTGKVEREGF